MDVFRITDRFKITGRGTVYTIKISKDTVLQRLEEMQSSPLSETGR